MDCKDWSHPRRDSAAQQQWGAFLVQANLTQQAAIDMDEEQFKACVREQVEDLAMREQIIGRRADLWNQFFGFDTSGRRASISTAGLDGAETAQAAEDRGADDAMSLSRRGSVDVLRGLFHAYLSDVGKTEQDVMAMDEKEFLASLSRHTADQVLIQRLRGHRDDLWGAYFGFDSKRGSMDDLRVRRASFTRNSSNVAAGTGQERFGAAP